MAKCIDCGLLKDSITMVDNGEKPFCLWNKEKIENSNIERKCKHFMSKIPNLNAEKHYEMKFKEKQRFESYWFSIIAIIISALSIIIAALSYYNNSIKG